MILIPTENRPRMLSCNATSQGQVPSPVGDSSMTVQAVMWQEDIDEVARFIQACFVALTDSASGCGSSEQPQDGRNDV